MQILMGKILDTCTQAFDAWTPQGGLADLIPGFIIGIFYAAVLFLTEEGKVGGVDKRYCLHL